MSSRPHPTAPRLRTRLATPVFAALFVASASAQTTGFPPEQLEFFEKNVRPVLADHCFECHSGAKAKAGLRLDSRKNVLKGSEFRLVVDPQKPEASVLLLAVKHAGGDKVPAMPHEKPKLPDPAVAALEQWLKMGAPWPEDAGGLSGDDPARSHWAYQPVKAEAVPADFRGNPIDWFVGEKLREAGLESAPAADRETLVRRAHLDLTGLPPTADEARAFVTDPRPDAEAWPALVDKLLASPHYGERWARHWMDVARYSDTRGYEAGGRERRFVYSYVYRDWLVRSFNEDMPFDQFTVYQLAADRVVDRDGPDKRHLGAMGFLTLSKNGPTEEVIDDRLDTTFRGFQALTIGCARCHDHKSDPIPTKEYYGLYGVLGNSFEPEEAPVVGEPKSGPEYEAYLKKLAEKQKVVDDFLNPKLAEAAEKFPELANRQAQLLGKLERADRRKLQDLEKVVDKFVADAGMEPDRALILEDRERPAPQAVYIRGNPGRRGDIVPRRFLTVVAGEDTPDFKEGSGRLEMARAIADAKNPLTARVIVNRVWMHLFGEGIVRGVSDFGVAAQKPSHPELLDWLASWFVENGWSIKKLNRLILTSETWRQSSSHPRADSYAGVDGDNRLLWRQNRRRMDFEQMRDSMIAVTGQLDRTLGGRCVEILQPPYSNRRTVYAFIDRQNLDPTFRNFDFSNPQQHTGQRPVTSIPMQGLFSLNSPFVQDKAKKLADLPPVRGAADDRARAAALHRAVLTRDAGPRDLELAEAFVRDFRAGGGPLLKRQTVTEWEYGYGSVDETTGEAAFTAYSHWTGDRWQVGAAFPLKDDPRSYLSAGPNGSSHPGYTDKECSIYRWTAPRDLTIRVSGPVERAAVGKGTGLGLRVAVSGQGIVLKTTLPATEKQKAVTVDKLTVKAGDTVDFIADPLENNNSFDSYNWRPEIADLGGSRDRWSQTAQFSGPADFMNEWEAYAQALLGTNDFLFVD